MRVMRNLVLQVCCRFSVLFRGEGFGLDCLLVSEGRRCHRGFAWTERCTRRSNELGLAPDRMQVPEKETERGKTGLRKTGILRYETLHPTPYTLHPGYSPRPTAYSLLLQPESYNLETACSLHRTTSTYPKP